MHHAAVLQAGYTDNRRQELAGASGAVSRWTAYMKAYGATFPADNFPWPTGTQRASISSDLLQALNVSYRAGEAPALVELAFNTGEPAQGSTIVAPATSSATARQQVNS